MPHHDVTLRLPADLYHAMNDAAGARRRSLPEHVETVLRQSVQPPKPDRRAFSLTPAQDKLHRFLCAYQKDHPSRSPSFAEMAESLGLRSKSSIVRLMLGLEERGVVRRLPNRARAIEILVRPVIGHAV